MWFSCTAINNIALVQPERAFENAALQKILKFGNCVSSFTPILTRGILYFYHSWDCLSSFPPFFPSKCHNLSLFPELIFLLNVEKYGHSCLNLSRLQWKLQLWPSGAGEHPDLLVKMNLSLGNIVGLWRNFPVCIFLLYIINAAF